jgi:Phage protein (N4 Gp49/phage Sf6 gene 66) family
MPTTPNEASLEAKIREQGLNAPRLDPDHIESKIMRAEYWRVPATNAIVCALVLENGSVVTGMSAPVSAQNFREAVGQEAAYNKARQQIWQLEGYLMKERLKDTVVP